MRNMLFSILGFTVAAIGLGAVAVAVWLFYGVFKPGRPPQYEQWVCEDPYGYGHEVRWESKYAGTDIHVEI